VKLADRQVRELEAALEIASAADTSNDVDRSAIRRR
jgi:hypothetical protein